MLQRTYKTLASIKNKRMERVLTLELRYSPAKQKTKASNVTAIYGIMDCISIPDLFSMSVPRDCTIIC